jgi:hypothetical protein
MASDPSLASTLDKLKSAGNTQFGLHKFTAASATYTEAIILAPRPCPADLAPRLSVLYSNRAMCAKALSAWVDVEGDARSAIATDKLNPKAHYLLGLCLCRALSWVEGVRELELGLEMARRQRKPASLLKEFEGAIAAGRHEWHAASEREEAEGDDGLRTWLQTVVMDARGRAVAEVAAEEEKAAAAAAAAAAAVAASSRPSTASGARKYTAAAVNDATVAAVAAAAAAAAVMADGSVPPGSGGGGGGGGGGAPPSSHHPPPLSPLAAAKRALEADYAQRVAALEEVFREREAKRRARVVPQCFLCPITCELMLDPVVTPSGHSYEKAPLAHYLTSVKAEDPLSRKPVSAEQLAPNLGLKDAIQAWLAENPWAHPALPRDPVTGEVSVTGIGPQQGAGRGEG